MEVLALGFVTEDADAPVNEEGVELAHGHVVLHAPVHLQFYRWVRALEVAHEPVCDFADSVPGHVVAALAVAVVELDAEALHFAMSLRGIAGLGLLRGVWQRAQEVRPCRWEARQGDQDTPTGIWVWECGLGRGVCIGGGDE